MTPHEPAPIQIGDFLIERQIGAGGMGIVYLARQVSLDRFVALKVLGNRLTHPNDKARFQREAQAVAKLKHPNIATVHFVGQDDRLCYMAMEYIKGLSLREAIERLSRTTNPDSSMDDSLEFAKTEAGIERFDQPVATQDFVPSEDTNPYRSPQAEQAISAKGHIRRCCEIVRDVALALEHAHGQGVIHRDLKPDNIMLGEDGEVRIIDFGVARFLEDASITQTGALVGTPIYMSPEQVTGRIDLDHRTDIYSLGMVLYELLTLVQPIKASTRDGVLRKIVTKTLVPVSWRSEAVPTDLENVVHKATARDPDDRYQSAEEFADDLKRHLDGNEVSATTYRYRLDESEVRAARPTTVVVLTIGIASKGIFLAVLACYTTLMVVFERRPAEMLAPWIVAIPYLGIAWEFFRGSVGGWWLAFIWQLAEALLLSALLIWIIVTWSGDPDNLFMPIILFCQSIPWVVLILLNRTRNWFRFAHQLRMEHTAMKRAK